MSEKWNKSVGDRMVKHGHSARRGLTSSGYRRPSSEYASWHQAKQRCTNPKKKRWARYGGRGIKMCDRWLNSFENFLADMGPKPSPKHTIERVNNDGDYEPGNCIWSTRQEQNKNTSQTRKITVNGVTRCRRDWERLTGFDGYLGYYLKKKTMDEVVAVIQHRLIHGIPPSRTKHKNFNVTL